MHIDWCVHSGSSDQLFLKKMLTFRKAFTPIKVKDLVTEIVLRTTLLTFVGPDLAENAELQNAVSEFSSVVRDIAICLLFVPKFMRPWVHPFLPPNFRMRRLHVTVRRILFSSLDSWNKDCGFPTIVQHFVATSKELKEEEIISKLLTLIAAAVRTYKLSRLVRQKLTYSSSIP
jgi:hypothetical protein